jgi:hypothetical protein
MKIGDLVEISDPRIDFDDDRRCGNVLGFDTYDSDWVAIPEQLIEVHWNNGTIGWILQRRVRLIKDLDELTYAQLEEVHGGMTPELFELWRCSLINKG